MSAAKDIARRVEAAAAERFGTTVHADTGLPGLEELARSLEHRSHRKFAQRPVAPDLLRLLFACAFSAPSKSDLQQAEVIQVADPTRRKAIVEAIPDMPWIMDAA
ncbi:MAG TPA: nitroreductase family protein, partial [Burkholderiales bacterium]|nr:nitroreductase family protein [Burkholderiales bacterium]